MPKNGFSTLLILLTILGILITGYLAFTAYNVVKTPYINGSLHPKEIYKNVQPESSQSATSSATLASKPTIPKPSIPPLSVKPKVSVISPKGGETLKLGEVFNIYWTTASLPSDKKNWKLIASVSSTPQQFSVEGKTGLTIFKLPLENNIGYFSWKVERPFSDSWAEQIPDLDNISYLLRLCLVRVGAEEIYDMGYWTDPNGETVWCNDEAMVQAPPIFKIVTP